MRSPSGARGYVRTRVGPGVMGWAPDDEREEQDDGQTYDDILGERRKEFSSWDDATLDDREDAEYIHDFYDGYQWSDDEIDDFRERGQPVVTKNLIFTKVNYVLGVEMENRVDPRAYPRTIGYHDKEAEAITDALRYKADKDDLDEIRSSWAKDMSLKGSAFGVIVGDGVDFASQHVPWDRAFWDPHSMRNDFGDAKYMGMFAWMYRDDVLDEYVYGREDLSEDEADRRTRVIESTYNFLGGSSLGGESTEDKPRRRWVDLNTNRVRIFQTYYRESGVWKTCVWTYAGFIEEPREIQWVDEDGNSYDPMWGYSPFITRDGTRYGWVRNLVSPQEEINKRGSLALHESVTKSFMSEEGAIPNPDEFVEESQRSDGVATVAAGALKDNRVVPMPKSELVMSQVQMQDRAEAAIHAVGPNAANLPGQHGQSGRALLARQQAGSLELRPFFEGLRKMTLRAYRLYWYRIRQHWTEPMWVQVRDSEVEEGIRFIQLNQPMTRGERMMDLVENGESVDAAIRHSMGPRGMRQFRMISEAVEQQKQMLMQTYQAMAQQAQQAGQSAPPPPQIPTPLEQMMESELAREPFTMNDVARLDMDIILDTAPDSVVIKHEMYESLATLFGQSPMLMSNPKAVQEMIRLNPGLRSDDRMRLAKALDGPPPDPEQAQLARKQSELAMANLQAQVMESNARVQEAYAKIQKMHHEMQIALAKLQPEVAQIQSETAKTSAQTQKTIGESSLGVPAAAQLDIAQAGLADARRKAVPSESLRNEAQAARSVAGIGSVLVQRVQRGPLDGGPQ